MKALRILWLVVASVVLFPIITLFTMFWLVVCIRSARLLGMSVWQGIQVWYNYLKSGVYMNIDFVRNGL
jgi:hypothetical protein